ncbi:MAG: ECF transporter S component [Vallitaleaceae bacterium]|nr:ECF transporter S component [Vallitaleaceae bacterium]
MNKLFKNPRNLTFLGVMLAITIILDSTPLGAVPVGAVSATITHIPTILTGIILGPVAGFIMGTSLGIVSLIHAITRPVTILDPLFANPLVSVLPRMFIGVMAYYAYSLVYKVVKKGLFGQTVGTVIGAVIGSFTNTALVFLMLYIVYAEQIVEKVQYAIEQKWLDIAPTFKAFAILTFTTNAVAEAFVAAILTTAIAVAYFKYNKTRNV